MTMEEIIKIVSEHNLKMSGNKKNVLTPLIWVLGILGVGLSFSCILFENAMLQIFMCVTFSIVFIIFLVAYWYFLIKDPDRLQSEKYEIIAL